MKHFLFIQKGQLAVDVSKLKRKKIADDLASGKPLHIGASGDVTGKEQTELMTQKGKLAAQWYVLDPELYEAECQAMKHFICGGFESSLRRKVRFYIDRELSLYFKSLSNCSKLIL